MKKTIGFLVVLTALIGLLVMTAQTAIRPTNTVIQRAVDMKPHAVKQSAAGEVSADQRYQPVGVVSANPMVDSRGALITQSYNDVPGNVTAGNLVAVSEKASTPQPLSVHFGYRAKAGPGAPTSANPSTTNRMGYSAYDPLTGTYPLPGGAVIIADAGATSVEGGSTARMLGYPDGRGIVTGYSYPDADGQPDNFYIHVAKDFAPMSGNFGDQTTGSIMLNDTNIAQSWTAGTQSLFPYSVLDINGSGANDTLIYLLCDGGHANRWFDQLKVFRKVGTNMPGGADNTWTIVYTDTTYGYTNYGIACDPTSSRVAIYTTYPSPLDTTGGYGNNIFYYDSETGNPGSWSRHNLTNLTANSQNLPWMEVDGLFDSQGYLHLIYNATYYTGVTPYTSRNSIVGRGFHWSERNPANHYVFYDARWNLNLVCGRNGSNTQNIGQMAVSECENRLYIVYSASNDPAYTPLVDGSTDDCVTSQTDFSFKGNGEIFVTVSKDLNGNSWDRPRNVSNSYTPDCDTGTCASDMLPSMTPYGIDDADFAGTENWVNSSATWDLSGGTYTGSKWLQVFYLQDKYPARAGQTTGGLVPAYTLNDYRWVRMNCAPPIVAANLTLSRDSIAWPEWNKPGNDTTFKIILYASGNSDMTFSSISDIEDSAKGPGAGPTGWMSICGAPGSIPEGGVDSMYVTLNAGGVITSGPTALFGKVRYQFTPPAQTKDLVIRFTVADTLVTTVWDTVSTACLDLAVGSDGNMGHSGGDGSASGLDSGRVNMDYFGTVVTDCDTGANSRGNSGIYLYDGSPIIIRKPTPSTYVGSWSAWSEGYETGNGFKPVIGYAAHGSFSTASYDAFNSGTFVTVDSLIKVERTWYAPINAESCNFVIERTRIFPATIGSAVTNLQIGEVIDWDIPSDTGGNVSGTDPTRKLIYMRGYNRSDTVTDCADNSRRYGGMALLNWFMKNKSCYDSLYGAATFQNQVYVYPGVRADSMSRLMHIAGYISEPAVTDLSAMLTFKDAASGYTLPANDTLTIYTALASVKTAASTNAGIDSLKKYIDKAKEFMKKDLKICASCCTGVTGNVDMTGIVDLSDLSALVSYLTGGGYVLPCQPEANVDNSGIVDLSDLSALVSYLTGGGYVLPACAG